MIITIIYDPKSRPKFNAVYNRSDPHYGWAIGFTIYKLQFCVESCRR